MTEPRATTPDAGPSSATPKFDAALTGLGSACEPGIAPFVTYTASGNHGIFVVAVRGTDSAGNRAATYEAALGVNAMVRDAEKVAALLPIPVREGFDITKFGNGLNATLRYQQEQVVSFLAGLRDLIQEHGRADYERGGFGTVKLDTLLAALTPAEFTEIALALRHSLADSPLRKLICRAACILSVTDPREFPLVDNAEAFRPGGGGHGTEAQKGWQLIDVGNNAANDPSLLRFMNNRPFFLPDIEGGGV